MKRLALILLLVCATTGYSQEGGAPIKVTSTLHGDGTRTDTQKDIDNHTSETKAFDSSKKLLQRCVYTLDEQGREVEGVVYNAKDVIVSRVAFSYDPLGRVSEQIEKTPNGVLLRRLVFTRDAKGRTTVVAYDAQGNVIKEDGSTAPASRKKGSRR
ncbi:MAG: hypothetical protein NTZ46_01645 [Verrucomicrobia bacterium]|nr:hypothetical protein [Verrucomicrobiota bacterium]